MPPPEQNPIDLPDPSDDGGDPENEASAIIEASKALRELITKKTFEGAELDAVEDEFVKLENTLDEYYERNSEFIEIDDEPETEPNSENEPEHDDDDQAFVEIDDGDWESLRSVMRNVIRENLLTPMSGKVS